MILVLTGVQETRAKEENSNKEKVVFVHHFSLDPKFPQNKEFIAATFQLVTLNRDNKYVVGEYYTFTSVPLTTPEVLEEAHVS